METVEELKKRIAELEEENKQLKSACQDAIQSYNKIETLYGLKCQQLELREEENAKLQEQLKNTFCPKYKIYQTVWFIDDFDIDNNCGRYKDTKNIQKRVRKCFVESIVQIAGKTFLYHIQPEDLTELEQDPKEYTFFWEMSKQEYDLFATEAEAQKYLEEHK